MRISDWSSDVCSSDLPATYNVGRSHFHRIFMRFTHRGPAPRRRNDLQTVKSLLPFVWQFKWRVIAALTCLVAAKVASVILPIYLKEVVDKLSVPATLMRSEEHTSELQSLMRISYAVFCLKKKK